MTNFFDTSDDEIFDINSVTGMSEQDAGDVVGYAPWYKPRKQFIRSNQWWISIYRTFNDKFKEMESVKYFGLPGADLLDLEYFSDKLASCENAKNTKLYAYGFVGNKKDKTRIDGRLTQLLDKDNVDPSTKIDESNFVSLSSEKAMIWKRVYESGPFHFINLDFCDCIFSNVNILDSILKLLHYQIERQTDDWLFSISTRFDKDGVNKDIFPLFDGVLSSLEKEVTVKNKIEECFSALENKTSKLEKFDRYSKSEIYELVQVCFVLWILNFTFKYGCMVELQSSMKYRVDSDIEFSELFSLVFKFTPKSYMLPDDLGVFSITQGREMPSEADLLERRILRKINALTKLSSSIDVDTILSENKSEFDKCTEEKIDLLNKAGVNTSRYKETFPYVAAS